MIIITIIIAVFFLRIFCVVFNSSLAKTRIVRQIRENKTHKHDVHCIYLVD